MITSHTFYIQYTTGTSDTTGTSNTIGTTGSNTPLAPLALLDPLHR